MKSWSVSTDRTWKRCQRQFFFSQHMASHNARDEKRREAFLLKQIQQPDWWSGSLVHLAIQRWVVPALSEGIWPAFAQVEPQIRAIAEMQFQFSRDGLYRTVKSKKAAGDAYCVLAPHFFGTSPSENWYDDQFEKVRISLLNLLHSARFRQFLAGRQSYECEIELKFKIDEQQITAKPDLLMPSSSGIDIIDWKVSKHASNHSFQLAVYGLALHRTKLFKTTASRGIRCFVVNLLDDKSDAVLNEPYIIGEQVLDSTENAIFDSIQRIRALTGTKSKYADLHLDWFDFARSTGTCALCNWKSLCLETADAKPHQLLSDHDPKPTQLALPFG